MRDDQVERRLKSILAAISGNGGRVTAPRKAIVETMLESADHVTAETLAEEVHIRYPSINRSTVYRTLNVLEEMGIVDHVHLGHGRAVYHLADRDHQHLVCEACQAVEEIPLRRLRPLVRQLDSDYGFVADTRHFAIVGICKTCRRGV